jgi:hypothetical protein
MRSLSVAIDNNNLVQHVSNDGDLGAFQGYFRAFVESMYK